MIFLLILILFFPFLINSARIIPHTARYITLSTTNAYELADYNFTMITESPIPPLGILEITFPSGQYETGLGLANNFEVIFPYPHVIPATVNDRTLICSIGEFPSQTPLTITVKGVRNPLKVGGTGNFRITSRITTGGYIIDDNLIFGVIGISSSPNKLIDSSVYIDGSSLAGELTDYIFSFVPSELTDSNIVIKIIFPDIYYFDYVISNQCNSLLYNGFQISGDISCKIDDNFKNIVYFIGIKSGLPKGQIIKLKMKKIYNPTIQMTTDLFKFSVLDKGSNNTLLIDDAVLGVKINTGKIELVSMTNYYPNYNNYQGYTRLFRIIFKPNNPFISIRISTDFIINKCYVIKGLLDIDMNSNVNCVPQRNILFIYNFQQYQKTEFLNDYVEVIISVNIPNNIFVTNPIEIYTYMDLDYLKLVDQDVSNLNTRISIESPPTICVACTIAIDTFDPSVQVTLDISLKTALTSNPPISIQIEIPEDFTGIPICQYNDALSAITDVYCYFLNGFLEIDLLTLSISGVCIMPNCPFLQITGLINPAYAGIYDIRVLIVSAGANTISFTDSFVILQNQFLPANIKINPLVNLNGEKTILIIDINLENDLPVGMKNMMDPYTSYSYIDIKFELENAGPMFLNDLNLGSLGILDGKDIGCEYSLGIEPYFSKKLECILIKGPNVPAAGDYAIVRIQNYISMFAGIGGKKIIFSIPIFNVATSPKTPEVQLEVYRIDKKVVKLLKSGTITLTATNNVDASSNLITSSCSFTGTEIQNKIDITVQFSNTILIPKIVNNNSIIIYYATGYDFNMSEIKVTLDSFEITSDNLHYVPTINLFMINLPFDLTAMPHNLIISKIRLPMSKTPGIFNLYTGLTNDYKEKSNFVAPLLTSGTFNNFLYLIDTNQNGFPYSNHTISFITTKYIMSGGKIKVIFTSDYTLTNTYCNNIYSFNLKDFSELSKLTCSVGVSEITITNFFPVEKNTKIKINLLGIRNPNLSGTKTLTVKTTDSLNNEIEIATYQTIITEPGFSPFSFSAKVEAFPNNAQTFGMYTFTFSPTFIIPKDSVISLNFPLDYGILYDIDFAFIDCLALGGITRLKGCTFVEMPSTKSIFMETLEYSKLGQSVTLQYFGLVSYSTKNNNVGGFSISITYYGTIIAQTSSNFGHSIEKIIDGIYYFKMDYYPKNEGEKANYVFSFTSAQQTITKDQAFFVRFPIQYDNYLSPDNLVITSSDLTGSLKYKLIKRHIMIYGFYSADIFLKNITINIWGVVNPNRVKNIKTNTFSFGILAENRITLIEAKTDIPGIIPLLAPGAIQLINASSSTINSRYLSDYSFNFYTKQNILNYKLGGLIMIDFPKNFLIDSYSGKCDVDIIYSFFSNCILSNNRFFFNATNLEWNPLSKGKLNFTIYDVPTPDDNGETLNFVVYNYDNITKTILGRTYSTLNKAYLNYEYDGLQIYVNDDQEINLEVGTFSNWYTLRLDSPSIQSLTLTPTLQDTRIIVDEFPLSLQLGQKQTQFRLAAPRDILLQTYYITWSKAGDSFPPVYAPLRRTKINMVKGTLKRVVYVEYLYYIPLNGTTYPLLLYTDYPPYQQLTANISFSNKILPSRFYNGSFENDSIAFLSDNVFIYNQKQNYINYTLDVSLNYSEPTISLYYLLSGYDSESYELNTTFMTIPITDIQLNIPLILSASVIAVNRSQVKFSITTDTLGFLYYIIADMHMIDPLFEEVKKKTFNISLNYSNPKYDVYYVKQIPMNVQFTVSLLDQGKDYEVFFFIMNMNKIHNDNFTKLYFKTKNMQKIAIMTLKIAINNLTNDLTNLYITKLAQMISISPDRLVPYTINCTLNPYAFNVENTAFLSLTLLPIKDSENDLNSPLALVEKLNLRRNEIQSFIPRLDSDSFVTMANLPDDVPSFILKPTYDDVGIDWFQFRFSINKCGTLYMVAIPQIGTRNDTETKLTNFSYENSNLSFTYTSSYQIMKKLNQTNLPAIYSSIYVNSSSSIIYYNMTGFIYDKLIYKVYFTTENYFPKYPILTDNISVAVIEMKTLKRRKPLDIYSINGSQMLSIVYKTLLFILIIVII